MFQEIASFWGSRPPCHHPGIWHPYQKWSLFFFCLLVWQKWDKPAKTTSYLLSPSYLQLEEKSIFLFQNSFYENTKPKHMCILSISCWQKTQIWIEQITTNNFLISWMIQSKGVFNSLIPQHCWSFPAASELIQSLLLHLLNKLE